MAVTPVVKSFLIADMVIQEKGSNKWSAIGIFDSVVSKKFPAMHTSIGLYVRMADAEGNYNIRVEFCDTSGTKLAHFEGIRIRVTNKLATPDFGINIKELPLPKPGKYDFKLYFNDTYVHSCSLMVLARTASK